MDIPIFLERKHRFFGRIGYVTMPSIRSIEIDTEDDLAFANVISTHLSGLQT
jgi:CMP-N-acetylneuraminic acid synthetase